MNEAINTVRHDVIVKSLMGILANIRAQELMFHGAEGPLILARPSTRLSYEPATGRHYFSVEEVSCARVKTVGHKRHIVTEQGVLAQPAIVNGQQVWSKDRVSTLYVPLTIDDIRQLDCSLLISIRTSILEVVS